jgi:hypothetical protein
LCALCAHLITRDGGAGNNMMDCPRFSPKLAKNMEALGGVSAIVLSHMCASRSAARAYRSQARCASADSVTCCRSCTLSEHRTQVACTAFTHVYFDVSGPWCRCTTDARILTACALKRCRHFCGFSQFEAYVYGRWCVQVARRRAAGCYRD